MKLKELRENRNLSQADLGNLLGVTRQTIAAWENGEREPNVMQVLKLGKYLEVSVDTIVSDSYDSDTVFLFRADNKDMLTDMIKFECVKRASDYYDVEKIIGSIPTIPITHHLYEYDPIIIEKKAIETRDWLGIDDAPLGDVLNLLEEKGLKIIEICLDNEVSGFSAYHEDKGGVIYINKNHPVERQYFTALHELAHMIFHKKDYFEKSNFDKHQEKIREKIADHFAGALLLPRDVLEEELKCFNKKWIPEPVLAELKQRYNVSLRTVLIRAEQIGIIPKNLCFKQIGFLNKKYGKISEKPELYKQELRRLKRIVFTALMHEHISSSRAAEILNKSLFDIKNELGNWLEMEG
ncbi:XRE family transcriptional regulator [Seleniivibrio woodruffii]|uniref:XRE family transcriptional regulator n=1 Tax=Seleniivibrio woodruffii TaxID=1078050 RepID=UPI0024092528|nr:XRE family transcriptional regulator [Seleniivibrio woodruffii]